MNKQSSSILSLFLSNEVSIVQTLTAFLKTSENLRLLQISWIFRLNFPSCLMELDQVTQKQLYSTPFDELKKLTLARENKDDFVKFRKQKTYLNCFENVRGLVLTLSSINTLKSLPLPPRICRLKLIFTTTTPNIFTWKILPETLKSLEISVIQQQPIQTLRTFIDILPSNLEYLLIDGPIPFPLPCNIPETLKTIKFGDNYNEIVRVDILSFFITRLEFGDGFNQYFDPVTCFPKSLKYIRMGSAYQKSQILRYLPLGSNFVRWEISNSYRYKRQLLHNYPNKVFIYDSVDEQQSIPTIPNELFDICSRPYFLPFSNQCGNDLLIRTFRSIQTISLEFLSCINRENQDNLLEILSCLNGLTHDYAILRILIRWLTEDIKDFMIFCTSLLTCLRFESHRRSIQEKSTVICVLFQAICFTLTSKSGEKAVKENVDYFLSLLVASLDESINFVMEENSFSKVFMQTQQRIDTMRFFVPLYALILICPIYWLANSHISDSDSDSNLIGNKLFHLLEDSGKTLFEVLFSCWLKMLKWIVEDLKPNNPMSKRDIKRFMRLTSGSSEYKYFLHTSYVNLFAPPSLEPCLFDDSLIFLLPIKILCLMFNVLKIPLKRWACISQQNETLIRQGACNMISLLIRVQALLIWSNEEKHILDFEAYPNIQNYLPSTVNRELSWRFPSNVAEHDDSGYSIACQITCIRAMDRNCIGQRSVCSNEECLNTNQSKGKDTLFYHTKQIKRLENSEDFELKKDDIVQVFPICSACKLTSYCSITCQNKHWPEHKKVCKATSDALNAFSFEKQKSKNCFHPDSEVD